MATATWQGKVIADAAAADTVVVEGNIYFPIASTHAEILQASSHQTVCAWKGTAHYYDVVVDGNVNKNAAWHYPEPKDAAKQIKGRVAVGMFFRVAPSCLMVSTVLVVRGFFAICGSDCG